MLRLENNPMRAEFCQTVTRIEDEIAFLDERLAIWHQPCPEQAVLHQAKAAYLAALASAYWPKGDSE